MRENTKKVVLVLLVVALMTSIFGTMTTINMLSEPYKAVRIDDTRQALVEFAIGTPGPTVTAAATGIGNAVTSTVGFEVI